MLCSDKDSTISREIALSAIKYALLYKEIIILNEEGQLSETSLPESVSVNHQSCQSAQQYDKKRIEPIISHTDEGAKEKECTHPEVPRRFGE